MKKILFLLLAFLFVSPAFSQRPPKKVRQAFETMVPKAQDVSWTIPTDRSAKDKIYTADYNIDKDSLFSRFDHKGNWIMTVTFIAIENLPDAVVNSINSKYMNAKITKAARLEEPDFDGYGVVYIYLKDNWTVQISKDGAIERRMLKSDGFRFH